MRHVWMLVVCLFVPSFLLGQESRADLYGGYSYINIDTNGLTSRQNANGWEASISGNFNKWFAVEGAFSGYYKSYTVDLSGDCGSLPACNATIKVTDYSFAGGPRINFKPVFVHALFGGDRLTGTASAPSVASVSESQDGLAGLAGGGVQWKVSGPWSIRASADYVFTRHNIFGGPSVTQNNYRAGVGIVYSFGARHEVERVQQPPAPVPPPMAPQQPAPMKAETPTVPRPVTKTSAGSGMTIASLGVKVAIGRDSGAEITDEAPNGVAALAGLHPGDVINMVDGKVVRMPMELAAELSGRQPGEKVRIGFLIRRTWQTETVVLLGASD